MTRYCKVCGGPIPASAHANRVTCSDKCQQERRRAQSRSAMQKLRTSPREARQTRAVKPLEPLERLYYVHPEGKSMEGIKKRVCVECGNYFGAPEGDYPFCSFYCSRIMRRTCGYCGEKFTPGHGAQRFCKPACRQAYYRAEKAS